MATPKSRIEIERNVIEKFLMRVRDYVMQNRKKVKYISIAVLAIIVILISVDLYVSHVGTRDRSRFDAVMDLYRDNPSDQAVVEKCKGELRELIKGTSFGFVHQMSHYMLASILYDEKKFGEAYDLYMVFIKKSSSDILFIPLAVIKASACLEEQGKIDEAINLLSKYEDDKDFNLVTDQLLYNIGRLYAVKGDKAKSREYFTKLRTNFSESPYADKAKERMFYLSIQK